MVESTESILFPLRQYPADKIQSNLCDLERISRMKNIIRILQITSRLFSLKTWSARIILELSRLGPRLKLVKNDSDKTITTLCKDKRHELKELLIKQSPITYNASSKEFLNISLFCFSREARQ